MRLSVEAGRALLLALLLAFPAIGCRKRAAPARRPAQPMPVRFTEIAGQAGIDFVHVNGARGRKLMPETVGSGLAFLDYDSDGRLDVLVMTGRTWPGDPQPVAATPHLYRNEGGGRFTDVTKASGLDVSFYGMGVAVGDYDNDGDPDLYLTAVGPNYLFRNEGGSRFTNVTAEAGVIGVPLPGTALEHKWSTSAAWLDYDRDGRLDLFVACYVDYEHGPRTCTERVTRRHRRFPHGCPPSEYGPTHCLLYRNEGGGVFRNLTRQAGAWLPYGKSLGVAVGDYNDDNWPDLYVANDTAPSYLLRNAGDGTFHEEGLAAGVALREDGQTMAGMGVDWGDYKNNGRLALFVSDYQDATNLLFENRGDGTFADVSLPAGLDPATRPFLDFGGGFLDFDNDGWLDLFVANGHVVPEIGQEEQGPEGIRYKQHTQLFGNRQGAAFAEITTEAGPAFREERAGCGAAWGDLWNRGVLDILVAANTDAPLLMRHSDPPARRHFVSLRLIGTESNRDGIGARVWLTAGGLRQMREVKTSCSFLSSGDARLHFGLGAAGMIDKLEVRWPRGRRDTFLNIAANRFLQLIEGETALTEQPIRNRTPR